MDNNKHDNRNDNTDMIDTESTKTATQSRQETTTETTVNSSLNGIDMTGFETEIYYINSAEDFRQMHLQQYRIEMAR